MHFPGVAALRGGMPHMNPAQNFVVDVVGGLTIFFGVLWAYWQLWSWAMPQLWPTGPEGIVHPAYWPFVMAWGGIVFVGFMLLRSKQRAQHGSRWPATTR